MDVQAFLDSIRDNPTYADQIVYAHEVPARAPEYAEPTHLAPELKALLVRIGIDRLYAHQARSVALANEGRDVLVATGTASGKTLCYSLPILQALQADPDARALLLFPTKALCQDQFRNFRFLLEAADLSERMAGVFDGDTPSTLRRRLRDHASVVFSNPDMLHASLMSQHARWSRFLSQLRYVVLDEMHVYHGLFGSNMTHVIKRLFRLCEHYGSRPQIIGCSATIANPLELGRELTGRDLELVDRDGSPRGKKTYILWNPPRVRSTAWRSRRSANVEAHELMAKLVENGIATITFSKAKMTAELIHRYVSDKLRQSARHLASKVTPYRGGYLPEERREIERQLFNGELLGVSTTPALELGIDVGSLEACIIVGYPGTRASFFQQAGRAGRKDRESLVFLIGLDTSVNQYIMSHPDYLFEYPIEQAVVDPQNPYVITGHLRCASHELALTEAETQGFGDKTGVVLEVLESNRKVRKIRDRWYHAATETPQHEVSLRNYAGANVVIEDMDTGAILGEVNRYDSQPLLHPEAIYMHRGETYRVHTLDLDKNIAQVQQVEVDYYTQPLGGTDIHHIDQQLREKAYGGGKVCWGEVTAHFNTVGYEKIHFYSLDAISTHDVDLPVMVLETMAFWIVPTEELMEEVRHAGLDAHSGLRGIGYATRMLLPLFMTCNTLDFSHTVGSANSPWHTVFVYERYPHGLGFTERAYEGMHQILPMVLDNIRQCSCESGCPCCVGKPLRQFTTWNVERGEGSIPSKPAAILILERLIGDGSYLDNEDVDTFTDSDEEARLRLERSLRRRLERMREPQVFHPITPQADITTGYPEIERAEELTKPDVARRAERRRSFDRDLHRRIAQRVRTEQRTDRPKLPSPRRRTGSVVRPTDFPGRPQPSPPAAEPSPPAPPPEQENEKTVVLGDTLAAKARKLRKKRKEPSS